MYMGLLTFLGFKLLGCPIFGWFNFHWMRGYLLVIFSYSPLILCSFYHLKEIRSIRIHKNYIKQKGPWYAWCGIWYFIMLCGICFHLLFRHHDSWHEIDLWLGLIWPNVQILDEPREMGEWGSPVPRWVYTL